jgi:hypothetical protein
MHNLQYALTYVVIHHERSHWTCRVAQEIDEEEEGALVHPVPRPTTGEVPGIGHHSYLVRA